MLPVQSRLLSASGPTSMNSAYLLLCAMIVSLVLFQFNQRHASPVLAIVNRWLRWIIFALGVALSAVTSS